MVDTSPGESAVKIIVDSREQAPYGFQDVKYKGTEVETGTLSTGDYSIFGFTDRVAVERKSIDDMAGTLTSGRERFERELERSRGFEFFALVIEADMSHVARHCYRSKMAPTAFIQSLFSYQVRYGCHVIWAGSRDRGEYATHSLLQKFLACQEKKVEAIKIALGATQ